MPIWSRDQELHRDPHQYALDYLAKWWGKLKHYAETADLQTFVQSCDVLVAALEDPNQVRYGTQNEGIRFYPPISVLERHWMASFLENRDDRAYLLLHVNLLLEQLIGIATTNGDLIIAAELKQIFRVSLELEKELYRSATTKPKATSLLWNNELLSEDGAQITVPLNFGKSRLKQEVNDIEDVLEFLDKKNRTMIWSMSALERMPKNAHLIIQISDETSVRTIIYDRNGFQMITHVVSFEELSRKILQLHREMERGISTERSSELSRWFHKNIFGYLPRLQSTLYYVGVGIFSRLPISLFVDLPVIWLNRRPRFNHPAVSRLVKGTALWSTQAPEPLQWSEAECRAIAGFSVKPATIENVIWTLKGHGPVHLVAHTQSSGYTKSETKIFLQDGELDAEEISRHQLHAPLVFLSSCETSMKNVITDESTSLASNLLDAGVGAVIAMKWRIPDNASMLLVAQHFWQKYREGASIHEALRWASSKISTSHAHAFELHY